jgi:hypothetical protein
MNQLIDSDLEVYLRRLVAEHISRKGPGSREKRIKKKAPVHPPDSLNPTSTPKRKPH